MLCALLEVSLEKKGNYRVFGIPANQTMNLYINNEMYCSFHILTFLCHQFVLSFTFKNQLEDMYVTQSKEPYTGNNYLELKLGEVGITSQSSSFGCSLFIQGYNVCPATCGTECVKERVSGLGLLTWMFSRQFAQYFKLKSNKDLFQDFYQASARIQQSVPSILALYHA